MKRYLEKNIETKKLREHFTKNKTKQRTCDEELQSLLSPEEQT